MSEPVTGVEALAQIVDARMIDSSTPVLLVAIGGFGGAGKSTLADALHLALASSWRCAVVAGDDFLTPLCDTLRDDEWGALDRGRLVQDVVEPARQHGGSFTYERYSYTDHTFTSVREVTNAQIVIVESVGLVHLPFAKCWDLTVWVNSSLGVAAEAGKRRDSEYGSDHTELWDTVWAPNDLAYFERFRPDLTADILWSRDDS